MQYCEGIRNVLHAGQTKISIKGDNVLKKKYIIDMIDHKGLCLCKHVKSQEIKQTKNMDPKSQQKY